MRRCYGCFEQIEDGAAICRFCGYNGNTYQKDSRFIVPGTLLSNRYTIGKVVNSDSESISYIAWDSSSNSKVLIREYFPSDYVVREPGSFAVRPRNNEATYAYNDGFSRFVEKARQLFASGGSEKLYDCIPDNGTAYMILAYPAEQKSSVQPAKKYHQIPLDDSSKPVIEVYSPSNQSSSPFKKPGAQKSQGSGSGITVLTSKKKENRAYEVMRRFSLIPLWVKILVPSVIVVGTVLIILFSKGIIKFKPKNSNVSETTAVTQSSVVTESTKQTTETDPIVLAFNTSVMTFKGHSYACFSDSKTWEEAKKHCESLGGHLAVISSKEENDAIWAFVNKHKFKSVFFGLSDSAKNGEWKWVTAENSHYSNWNENKPSADENENYAEFSFYVEGGVWNNSRFESHFKDYPVSYVCEWESDISGAPRREIKPAQAIDAFRLYMAKTINSTKLKKKMLLSWGYNKPEDNIYTFHYEPNSKNYVVFYMDLSTGKTTSITYSDSYYRNAIDVGTYDFSAWEYLDNKSNDTDDTGATELSGYIGTNISTAAKEIGNLGTLKQGKVSYYANKNIRLSTNSTKGSTDISTISLSGSANYCIYGVTPGMTLKEAIKRLTLSGCVKLYIQDSKTIRAVMSNKTALQITLNKKNLVSGIKIWREIT